MTKLTSYLLGVLTGLLTAFIIVEAVSTVQAVNYRLDRLEYYVQAMAGGH